MQSFIPVSRRFVRFVGVLAILAGGAACTQAPEEPETPVIEALDEYATRRDGGFQVPAVPAQYLLGVNRRALVEYGGDQEQGVIEIDPHAKFLYLVLEDGMAQRYPIAVGRQGRSLRNSTVIRRKSEWPGWIPTENMLRSEPEIYGDFARGIPGGLASPLGARALYLYQGSRDTYYRIHGTNDVTSIGNSGSAGCIRLFNQDMIDLYDQVELDTRVVIRTYADSVRIEGQAVADRGIELDAVQVDPDVVYAAVEAQQAARAAADAVEEALGLNDPDPEEDPNQEGEAEVDEG